MTDTDHIRDLSSEILGDVISYRRHIHRYPELSFQEKNTAAYIAGQLSEWGISYEENVGGYGVVGLITGDQPGKKTVALRADMDALPIQEENETEYASVHSGVMHACGHDVHSASLLGTAYVLNNLRSGFGGQIKLVFQPGEEKLPGGASLMIREGVLKNPDPDVMIGQHVHPPLEAGKVGFRPGQYMASSDELFITVRGVGGHGALPHQSIDTTLTASHIVVAMQQVVSRRTDPTEQAVLTLGKIYSDGGSTNIIPDTVHIQGTFRAMNETWRFEAHQLIRDIVNHTALAFGATAEIDIRVGYPYLFNEPVLTNRLRSRAVEYLGADQVVDLPIQMTSEDFAFYSHEVDSCFYRLGVSSPGSDVRRQLHTPSFDVDERCFQSSIGLMTYLTLSELADNQ